MNFFKSGKYILIERKSTDFNGTGWQWMYWCSCNESKARQLAGLEHRLNLSYEGACSYISPPFCMASCTMNMSTTSAMWEPCNFYFMFIFLIFCWKLSNRFPFLKQNETLHISFIQSYGVVNITLTDRVYFHLN